LLAEGPARPEDAPRTAGATAAGTNGAAGAVAATGTAAAAGAGGAAVAVRALWRKSNGCFAVKELPPLLFLGGRVPCAKLLLEEVLDGPTAERFAASATPAGVVAACRDSTIWLVLVDDAGATTEAASCGGCFFPAELFLTAVTQVTVTAAQSSMLAEVGMPHRQ